MRYPMCFVAGTPVHTIDGLKSIEDIRSGDLVLTRDENDPSSPNRYRQVTELFQTSPTRLLTIRYQNATTGEEESVSCTGEHPFYVADRYGAGDIDRTVLEAATTEHSQILATVTIAERLQGSFLPADELILGDRLVLSNGLEAVIVSIDQRFAKEGETFTTYNFAVEDDHTYFVGSEGVWVHNSGNPCDEAFEIFVKKFKATDNPFDALEDARNHLLKQNVGDALIKKHLNDLEIHILQKYAHKLKATPKALLTVLQRQLDDLAEKHLLPKFKKIDSKLESGYTGSFKTGVVGNVHKDTFGNPIDLDYFDVDYWIKSDILYNKFGDGLKADVEFRSILNKTPGFEGLKPHKKGFSIKFLPSTSR